LRFFGKTTVTNIDHIYNVFFFFNWVICVVFEYKLKMVFNFRHTSTTYIFKILNYDSQCCIINKVFTYGKYIISIIYQPHNISYLLIFYIIIILCVTDVFFIEFLVHVCSNKMKNIKCIIYLFCFFRNIHQQALL